MITEFPSGMERPAAQSSLQKHHARQCRILRNETPSTIRRSPALSLLHQQQIAQVPRRAIDTLSVVLLISLGCFGAAFVVPIEPKPAYLAVGRQVDAERNNVALRLSEGAPMEA